MPKLSRWRFLSFFGAAHVTQILSSFLFCKFLSARCDVEGMLHIIKKMTDFLETVLGSG